MARVKDVGGRKIKPNKNKNHFNIPDHSCWSCVYVKRVQCFKVKCELTGEIKPSPDRGCTQRQAVK